MSEAKEAISFEEVDISDSFDKLNDEQPSEIPPVVPKEEEIKDETSAKSDDDAKQKTSEEKDEKETKETGSSVSSQVDDTGGDGTSEDGTVLKLTIAGKEYTEGELQTALENSTNKVDWQKSNTEKAQETAELHKSIQPVIELINKLREDTDLFIEIKEAVVEKFGDEVKPIFDAAFKFDVDKHPNPYKTELETEQQKTRELQSEIVLSKEKVTLKELHKLKNSQVDEVYDFAVDKYNETGTFLSLEDAYKLMDYDVQVKKAGETKKPAIPAVIPKKKGATTIKKPVKLPEKFEDVDLGVYEGKLWTKDA